VGVKLASSNDIQAAVILHPGPLTIDEIRGKVLPSFLCDYEMI
jgi:carboxymethylenebutenolidase